ncbi:protein-tyrosine-phosphatase [Rhodomicrobium sp. Az07]|uniref:tyrosine phosphatase family protein n=1 Tax=Rhodomicrobium sp. Az07 TaxID=2839034 RepID=UPI001BE6EF08|nr:protein-tyrosine-phosphatase [Rhodomicrobium sp. Az07]MBT3070889.1 protein-tyrosine-phosphatase [Rhodomicrobium sp. Az07]
MPLIEMPFLTTVCGLEELAGHSSREVSHVLSILDPDEPEPPAFGTYGEHARLEMRFHDIIEETAGHIAPTPDDVAQMLAFGRDSVAEAGSLRHLLVHCHMGISRSTATMALLLAQSQPTLAADSIMMHIFAMRDKAWPNLRILEFGEAILGRNGEFTQAAGAIYRIQLERRPEIREFFVNAGRGREIDAADRV